MRKDPFDKVYEENYEKVYNAVYMRLLNRENTEDIVLDTFLKALNAYDSFDPKVSSVYTWLCRSATNTMYDQFRKNEVRKVISLDDLIVNKRASGRPKDIADALALEKLKARNGNG